MTNQSSTWTSPFDQALSAADAEPPAITTPDPMIGTPGQDARDWAGQRHYQDDCAIRCQEYLITQFTGQDPGESTLVQDAAAHRRYHPGDGTSPADVGNLLEEHGIPVDRYQHASAFQLANELAQGHKVIVGVHADVDHNVSLAAHALQCVAWLFAQLRRRRPSRAKLEKAKAPDGERHQRRQRGIAQTFGHAMQPHRNTKPILTLLLFCATLTACGGWSSRPATENAASAKTILLSAGQKVYAPSGVIVKEPNGATVTVNGHGNTVHTLAGAVVTVPQNAIPPRANIIVAQ